MNWQGESERKKTEKNIWARQALKIQITAK